MQSATVKAPNALESPSDWDPQLQMFAKACAPRVGSLLPAGCSHTAIQNHSRSLFQVLFNKFSKYLEVARTQIRLSILGIGVKHENLVLAHQVVYNSYAAALAASASHPPDLAQSSRLWNEVASFWIGDECGLEGLIRLIVDKLDNSGCENVSLIENHMHGYIIRQ